MREATVVQPTVRGRQTQAAIDEAARTVIARKGILATTVADIATEAGRSTASFYNYYDSKEAMVAQWAMRFRTEAQERVSSLMAESPPPKNKQRARDIATAHWLTWRHQLAEMISVSQMAMINAEFAEFWNQICSEPIDFLTTTIKRAQRDGFSPGNDPHLMATAIVSMMNQFAYNQLSQGNAANVDDAACIDTLAGICYRAIYSKEVC